MRLTTICARHNFTVLTGPGSLIEEYDCPACIAEADEINDSYREHNCPEYLAGGDCRHTEYDPDATKWTGVEIKSENYCRSYGNGICDNSDLPF